MTMSTTEPRPVRSASVRPLRIGILGCGYIADLHLQALGRIVPLDLRVTDVDGAAAERLARIHGGRAIEAEAFYAGEFDVAYICTPHDVRLEPLERLARVSALVVCEKPLGLTAAAAKTVRDRLGERGQQVVLAFNQRFMPGVRSLRRWLVARPEPLGRIRIDVTTPQFLDGWAGTSSRGGGVVVGVGSHAIDLWRHLLRREPVAVHAVGCRVRISGSREPDTAVMTMTDQDGRITTVTVQDSGSTWWAMTARRMLDIDVRLDGAAARASATQLTTWDDDLAEVCATEHVGAHAGDFLEEWGYAPMARAVLARLGWATGQATDSHELADINDGLACAQIVQRARDAIAACPLTLTSPAR